jgi:hypothetical protein
MLNDCASLIMLNDCASLIMLNDCAGIVGHAKRRTFCSIE